MKVLLSTRVGTWSLICARKSMTLVSSIWSIRDFRMSERDKASRNGDVQAKDGGGFQPQIFRSCFPRSAVKTRVTSCAQRRSCSCSKKCFLKHSSGKGKSTFWPGQDSTAGGSDMMQCDRNGALQCGAWDIQVYNDGWKTTFLLNWPLVKGHLLVFEGSIPYGFTEIYWKKSDSFTHGKPFFFQSSVQFHAELDAQRTKCFLINFMRSMQTWY